MEIKEKKLIEITKYSKCGYKGEIKLEMEPFSINSGSFTVILGPSGIGKSTFLETLGLMNNTHIKKDDDNILYNEQIFGIRNLTLGSLWSGRNRSHKSYLRNKYFSFIFQNTNLMPNFTVFENLICTSLFQKGVNGAKHGFSRKDLNKLVSADKLDLEELLEKYPNKISGGQRQRVAFGRAILPDYQILFADEPTGNLDERHSESLMKILRDEIILTKEENYPDSNNKVAKTAIIVSHNINLALKFATDIIVISKKDKSKEAPGIISLENMFNRDKADNNNWNQSGSFGEKLSQYEIKEKIVSMMYSNL